MHGVVTPWLLNLPRRLPFAGSTQRQRLPGGTVITVSGSVDMDPLEGFAEESGGRSWLLSPSWLDRRGSEINTALDEIAVELRNQYSIDYYPAHPIKDGKWYRVEVITKNPDYHVRARKEYFGRQPLSHLSGLSPHPRNSPKR